MFILTGHSRFLALTHSKLTLFQITNKTKKNHDCNTFLMTKPEKQIKSLKYRPSISSFMNKKCHVTYYCRTRPCYYVESLVNTLIQGLGAGTRNFLCLRRRLYQKHVMYQKIDSSYELMY